MELDAELATQFGEIDQKYKLPDEARQELISLYHSTLDANAKAAAESAVTEANTAADKAFTELNDGWVQTITKDPVLGGDNLKTNQDAIDTLIDAVAGPVKNDAGVVTDEGFAAEFREALNITGAGNHPGMFRMLVKLSSLAKESGLIAPNTGQAAPSESRTAAAVYPSMKNP